MSLRIFGYAIVFVLLTALTQVGGLLLLISIVICRILKFKRKASLILFTGLYLVSTVIIIPIVSPIFGRVPLPVTGNLQPLNYFTCLLNRHYVRPELKEQLLSTSNLMSKAFPGTKTNYLDANFPFFDGFPLPPHLSHNDGKKIDLAFYYTEHEELSNNAPSFIGYGVYVEPGSGEVNFPENCHSKGFWQYSLIGHFIPEWSKSKYSLDQQRIRKLLILLAKHSNTSKIFIEPHLKERWKLTAYNNIRYHGCHAVRHDDHIHVQMR